MHKLPALHGNWVDLIIVFMLIFYVWDGTRRGVILSSLDLLSFIVSFFAAIKFYNLAAVILIMNFNLPHGIANALGFLAVGFLTEILFSIPLRKILKVVPAVWLESRTEKLLGILPAIGNTIIIGAFVLTLIITLPVQGAIKSAIITSKLGGPLVTKTSGIEKVLNKVFGGAVEESLTFLTVKPASKESIKLNFTQDKLTTDPASEKKLFILVNKARQEHGLSPLKFATNGLQTIARAHARDMFKNGYFSHYNLKGQSPFDRMEKAGVKFTAAGENLALAPNVILAHQGLMNSPGHRANILSPDFHQIGIGVIDGGIYGKMFVQEFTD